MSEADKTDSPTLLEICKLYNYEETASSDSDFKEPEVARLIDAVTTLAKDHPSEAMDLTFLVAPRINAATGDELISSIMIPSNIDRLLDGDLGVLRRTTAHTVSYAFSMIDSYGDDESNASLFQYIAQMFRALYRTPGQKEEVRELADHFHKKYSEKGDLKMEMIADILFFTTVGQLVLDRKAAARRVLKPVTR